MDREIDYERFPRLKAVVMGCGLETQEEKERAFRALVQCLVSKNVYHPSGAIVRCRNTCLSYFARISSLLEEDELELMVNSVESFYQRFIFAPVGKVKSLFSEFQKKEIKSKFKDVNIPEIFEKYRHVTGFSPYEKATSEDELHSFIVSVEEESMFSLA